MAYTHAHTHTSRNQNRTQQIITSALFWVEVRRAGGHLLHRKRTTPAAHGKCLIILVIIWYNTVLVMITIMVGSAHTRACLFWAILDLSSMRIV